MEERSLISGDNCEGDYNKLRPCWPSCGDQNVKTKPALEGPRVDCQWSDWSKQGGCSKTCGRGIQKFSRHKLQEERHGGLPCSGADTKRQTDCNVLSCPGPVDCQWSEWSVLGGCSKTCGSGIQKWSRYKLQDSANGGRPCSGDVTKETTCNTQSCPCRGKQCGFDVDCVLSEWKNITSCSKSCGGGTQFVQRSVKVFHKYKGEKCPSTFVKHEKCNAHPCPGKYLLTFFQN